MNAVCSAFGSFVSETIFKDIAAFKTNNAVHGAWQLNRQHNDVVLIPLPCGSDAACGCNVERFGMCEARDERRAEIHLIRFTVRRHADTGECLRKPAADVAPEVVIQ